MTDSWVETTSIGTLRSEDLAKPGVTLSLQPVPLPHARHPPRRTAAWARCPSWSGGVENTGVVEAGGRQGVPLELPPPAAHRRGDAPRPPEQPRRDRADRGDRAPEHPADLRLGADRRQLPVRHAAHGRDAARGDLEAQADRRARGPSCSSRRSTGSRRCTPRGSCTATSRCATSSSTSGANVAYLFDFDLAMSLDDVGSQTYRTYYKGRVFRVARLVGAARDRSTRR